MKTKIISKMTFMAVMALFSSCSSENVITDSMKTDKISFTVSQENFAGLDSAKTRTTDSGTSTTFSSGDAIGIYVVNGSTVTNANLKYTYDGSIWSNTTYGTSVPFVAGGKYFAYYPYMDNVSSITASATTAEAFFATVISGWTPATSQSTHALYSAQDLMISLGTASSSGYHFSMAHQMSRLEVDLPQVLYSFINSSATQIKYTFSNYTPYNYSSGAYYLIVKPGTTVSGQVFNPVNTKIQNWSFTVGSGLKGYYQKAKINSAAASLTSTQASPAVGNIYYSDGSYANYYNSAKTPIGVVVSTNSTYSESANGYGHGLVMALKPTSSVAWCTDVKPGYGNTPVSTVAQCYQAYDGLGNTNNAKKFVAQYPTYTLATMFPVFDKAVNYGTYPSGSSGWFVPGPGQLYKAIEDLAYYENNTTVYNLFKNNEANTTGMWNTTVFANMGSACFAVFNYPRSILPTSLYTTMSTSIFIWTASQNNDLNDWNYAVGLHLRLDSEYNYATFGINPKNSIYCTWPFLAF